MIGTLNWVTDGRTNTYLDLQSQVQRETGQVGSGRGCTLTADLNSFSSPALPCSALSCLWQHHSTTPVCSPSLLKFHRKFANLISKITCKLGMGRRNCKHGINVLLGILFITIQSYKSKQQWNDARISSSEWILIVFRISYSLQILICVSRTRSSSSTFQ